MEVLERVGRLEQRADGHDRDIERLEQAQDAAISRVEKKIDRVLFTLWGWSITFIGSAAVALMVYLLNRG